MKCFVTGIHGQLGRDTAEELLRRGHAVCGSGTRLASEDTEEGAAYLRLDITDREAVLAAMDALRPDVIVHCAAWTAVDAAEAEENRAAVRAVNADGTRYLAEAAKAVGAKLLYISTDYVFGGGGTEPWSPDCETFCPLNYYGETKLAGERALRAISEKFFIVRTSWAFGQNGNNFVRTMLRVGRTHDAVRVVNDQIGTPTYTRDLARLLADMAETEKYGVYHATNEGGYISWYDFTKEIYRQAGVTAQVIPVSTEEYGLSAAKRPRNSRLDKAKLAASGFAPLPDWQDALGRYLKEIGE